MLSNVEKKGERLTVRFRPGELNELSEQADMCGLSLSELVHRKAMQIRIVSVTDLKVLSELRRIGGLVKLVHNETNGLYRQKTAELLDELRAAVVRIGRRREGD
jgi:hypothetical protein